MLLAYGTLVADCLRVAERLRAQYGLRIGVINARFVKPLDKATILKAVEECAVRRDGRRRLPEGRLRLGRAGSGQRGRA